MKWFVKCFRNYVTFEGRARRSEFWYFVLFSFLFMLVARIADMLLFSDVAPFSMLLWLGMLLPYISVSVRRLHDTGRSGKLLLAYFCYSFLFSIVLMYMGLQSVAELMGGADIRFSTAQWVVLDYGDVVVHLFQKEARDFYQLEDFWADASVTRVADDGAEQRNV